MAKFQPHTMGAAKQLVVADKAHTNPIFNGHHNKVAQSAPRAKPQFSKGQNIGVIVDANRGLKMIGKDLPQWHIGVLQQWRPGHHSGFKINDPGNPNANGGNRIHGDLS